MFITLIREKKRHERYVRFLEVLCTCRGKAVRPNQWRVAKMLLEDASDLLLKLELRPAANPTLHGDNEVNSPGGAVREVQGGPRIFVSGSAKYFPKLRGGSMELADWLATTDPDTKDYFAALSSLYASLVRGRNLRVTPTLQRLLPYELILAIITDARLNHEALDVSRQFVRIATDLWVSNDIWGPPPSGDEDRGGGGGGAPQSMSASSPRLPPLQPWRIVEAHPTMVVIKNVRKWADVPDIARMRILASRYNLPESKAPDWSRFDELKRYVLRFLRMREQQNAMHISQNRMVLELAKCVHALVMTGFYRATGEYPRIPTRVARLASLLLLRLARLSLTSFRA